MRTFIKKHVPKALMLFLALGFVACEEDDEVQIQITSDPTDPVLAALDIDRIQLDGNNVNNPAMTFTWEAADYGEPTEIKYTIEFSSDAAFTSPFFAGEAIATTSRTFSMAEANAGAGGIGLPPFAWNTVYARVVSSIGQQDVEQQISNSIEFEVFPYFNYPFEDYFLVGDATAPNWDNNNSNPAVFRDPADTDAFHYTGRFAGGGHFKLLNTLGQWQPQWGSNSAVREGGGAANGEVDVNLGDGNDPERFPYAGGDGIDEGYYTFFIDFGNNTFTFQPFDTSGAVDYTSMTMQGSAVGSDVQLTQSTFDSHIWLATNVTLSSGDLQFLTSAGTTWGGDTEFSGVATENGNAIPVPVEDEYNLWFNDLTGDYIMIPINLSQS